LKTNLVDRERRQRADRSLTSEGVHLIAAMATI